jgi:hypothetical protein
MVMTAAMMRKTLEQAGQTSNPSNAEQMALEKGMITVNILITSLHIQYKVYSIILH